MGTKSRKTRDYDITIIKKMRDYSNDPFFKKKEEEAIKLIKKHGLPESFKKRN